MRRGHAEHTHFRWCDYVQGVRPDYLESQEGGVAFLERLELDAARRAQRLAQARQQLQREWGGRAGGLRQEAQLQEDLQLVR